MSSQEQKTEQTNNQSVDTASRVGESVVNEATAGKSELIAGIKKAIDVLKSGGTSGITGEFGKPLILGMAEQTPGLPQGADGPAAKKFVSGEIKGIKSAITGEFRIPPLFQQSGDAAPPAAPMSETSARVAAPQVLPEVNLADLRNPGQEIADVGRRLAEAASHYGEHKLSNPATEFSVPQGLPTESKNGDPAARDRHPDSGRQPGDRSPHPAQHDNVVHMDPINITVSPDIAYRGEVINRDIQPGRHTVQAGESLSRIARDHLGPGASQDEIQKHAREIARVNHITNPNRIHAGQDLTLPGHTHDGGFVSNDNAGSTLTRWHDGTERITNSDNTGYVRKPTADGGYNEHHWGPQPENNFEVTSTPEGRLQFADRPGEQPRELYDTNQVHTERQHLNELAESRITNPQELSQFRAHMAEFEERAHRQNLPPEEVAKTYHEMSRLLESRGDQPVSQRDRVVLTEQVMDQAAHPTSIDQGQHNTCNVTTVESRLYTRNPSEAARLVTDVATTGSFTTRDGQTTVAVPPGSIGKDTEAQGNPPAYGDRSYASQLFQVTALNLHYQTSPYTWTDTNNVQHNVPAGGMRYEQIQNPTPPDTGERLYDTTTNPPTLVSQQPDITDDGIVRVNNRLTGDTGNGAMIDHSEYVYGDRRGVDTVNNEQELNDKIRAAAEAHPPRLPLIIGVHTGNEPFLHDSGGGTAGGSGGGHVVTVTGYEAGPPARVHVDNQWGEGVDYQGGRTMSVHDLYMSMRPPDNAHQIADLQRDVDWDRAHNTVDTRKEFELLRLRHNLPATDPNRLSDADYDRGMREQIDAAAHRWEQQCSNGTFNQAEHDNAMQKLNDMTPNKPANLGIGWIERMHQDHLLTDREYDQALSREIRLTRARFAQENGTTPPSGNAAERQASRTIMLRLLNELPPDRRQQVMDNSR
jgi:LysM repeat protein